MRAPFATQKLLLIILLAGAPLCANDAASSLVESSKNRPVEFQFKKRPSLRSGDWLRLDFRTKVQTDVRGFSPDLETEEGVFDPRRLRLGVEGRLFRDVEFELEYELRPADHQLRDAFVNYRRIRQLQLQAGKFKVPFGLDQLTGPVNLEFVYRSRIGSHLAPGRDSGVMLHGSFFEKALRYQAGVFRHDGEIAETGADERTGEKTAAGRIILAPASFFPAPSVLRSLQIGAAFTHSHVSEGRNSLRGRTAAGETFFSRMFVNGARIRQGAELSWLAGSLSLKGEYMNVREQRLGQGLLGNDLPDLISRGWYASATHPLLGRRKDPARGSRLREFLPGARAGLLEAAARYEQIRFGGRRSSGLLSRGSRAANVLGNSDRALTLGVNWFATTHTKFQFNVIREVLEDAVRTPLAGRQRYWMFAGRMQFVL